MAIKLIIGGPAYNLVVDARHTASVAGLAVHAARSRNVAEVSFHYTHNNPVDRARDDIMGAALASDSTHLVSVDYDVSWVPAGSPAILLACELLERGGLPFCAFPYAQRDGNSSVILDSTYTKRLAGSVEMSDDLRRCWAAGMGLVVHWLPWYREHWPNGPWFRTDFIPHPDGSGAPFYISEDIWHTSELNLRGFGPGPRYMVEFEVKHARGTL